MATRRGWGGILIRRRREGCGLGVCVLGHTRKPLHNSEQVSSPLRVSASRGQRGVGMVHLSVPSARVPGLQPSLAGCAVVSGQVSFWSDSSFLLCHPLLWHQQEVLGWLVCAQEAVAGGRLRTFQAYLGKGGRKKACWAVCLPKAAAPSSSSSSREGCAPSPSPTPPNQASIPGRPSPSSPGTSCSGTAPDGFLAWGQRPHCAQPWTGLRLGHTEPFCPHMGVGTDGTR